MGSAVEVSGTQRLIAANSAAQERAAVLPWRVIAAVPAIDLAGIQRAIYVRHGSDSPYRPHPREGPLSGVKRSKPVRTSAFGGFPDLTEGRSGRAILAMTGHPDLVGKSARCSYKVEFYACTRSRTLVQPQRPK